MQDIIKRSYERGWQDPMYIFILFKKDRDFPGGPVVKNLPSNAWDVGSIPGQGTKIPQAVGELRSHRPWGN